MSVFRSAPPKFTMRVLWCLLALGLGAAIPLVSAAPNWWQKTIIYQIYPRSFKDSNGDGVGDLNGITQGLPHIKDAGIGCIWLSPIYKSPMYDAGYDIADFKAIQPEYGTMEDFENLLAEAAKLDIKVILDFVPNHSSNESDWFDLSANRTKGYENYFVWADGKPDPNNPGKTIPPSNWISIFRKSAWEWNEVRGQYYLHQFVIGQPDLNYREPLVVEEMKNVLRFWLEKGVAGFRIDALPSLFEVDPKDFGGVFPDEPKTNIRGLGPDDYGYLNHIYTSDLDPTYDMVYQWRSVLDEFEKADGIPRAMLTESYSDIKLVMRYYGNGTHNGSVPFNFEFLRNIDKNSDARDIKFIIDKWETYMPVGKTANWVNGNHDNSRMASRHGVERADIMNMLALLLPGVALTYQGEELAMTDGEVSWEETQDPQACNTDDPINYYKSSRDPARTPYQWDNTKNAGFSTANKTWLPVASNYQTVNLKAQEAATKSHYKFYQDIAKLRSNTTSLQEGDLDVKAISTTILALMRSLPNAETIVGVINLATTTQTVSLDAFRTLPTEMTVYTSSLNSKLQKGEKVKTAQLTLSPNDAVVLTI